MKAIARRRPATTFTHDVEIRDHRLVVDEPIDKGGDDRCEYELPARGYPAHFTLALRLSGRCSDEQLRSLRVIAGKCPVQRILEDEVTFEERVERGEPAPA